MRPSQKRYFTTFLAPVSCILLVILTATSVYPQNRDYRIHQRGLLHQTEYNTGELGRTYDNGTAGMIQGFSSMEWPPNSYQIIDRTVYYGQHNSFGGGIWISGTRAGVRQYDYCGAVSDNNGNATQVEGIYSHPISIERIENYPVLADGKLNPAYNPDEAEEVIIAKWSTPLGVTITRTSRAWSFPGYDSFIIYEYKLENTTADSIKDMIVAFPYGFCPSMFGYERATNRWAEADLRANNQFARWDLHRWMTYNHDRIGKPDSVFFDTWSQPGNRGGLNSPQAAGLLTLHVDYDHLATKGNTALIVTGSDTVTWDQNMKIKQPFLNRYENGNLYPSKIQLWMDPAQSRKTRGYRITDSIFMKTIYPDSTRPWTNCYWMGRCRPSVDLGNAQPAAHGYGFGPYILRGADLMQFSLAEVVGYGAGVAGDTAYLDVGGGVRGEPEPYLHPVPSWYNQITYANLGTPSVMGSNYLQSYPLPWYVTPGVVSIRDVADRAIQLYTGQQLVKYDTLQFKPDQTSATGTYNTLQIPVPSPIITIYNSTLAKNKITWEPYVESFSTPRLHAPFHHYEAFRAVDPLGPWVRLDSVGVRDPRYFHDSVYILIDTSSVLGASYYYTVVSVDDLGGRSGMLTSMSNGVIPHKTDIGPASALGKVYVVPNPLIVSNSARIGFQGLPGNPTDQIEFFGLTAHCTIRVFSYAGQLIATIRHDGGYYHDWYQISRNNQLLASGVYYFVVEDDSGARAHGKFVIIH